MEYKQKLQELLLITTKQNASDLHIGVGRRPTLRVDSVLVPLANETVLMPSKTKMTGERQQSDAIMMGSDAISVKRDPQSPARDKFLLVHPEIIRYY